MDGRVSKQKQTSSEHGRRRRNYQRRERERERGGAGKGGSKYGSTFCSAPFLEFINYSKGACKEVLSSIFFSAHRSLFVLPPLSFLEQTLRFSPRYHPLFRQRLVTSHPHVFKIVVETKFAISVVFRRSQDLVTRAAGRFHSLVIFSTRSRCLSHTLPFSSVLLHANAANGKRGMANGNGKRMNATSRRRRRCR